MKEKTQIVTVSYELTYCGIAKTSRTLETERMRLNMRGG